MRRYITLRVIRSLATIFGVMTLTFLVVSMLPGDAVQVLLVDAPKEYVEEMRHALGLDRPIHVQYVEWIVPLVTRLDMGKAIIAKEPINKMLLDRLPVTIELAFLAMLFSSVVALPLGILAARHRGGWVDYTVMQFSQLGQVVPAFWIGTLLFFALGVKLQVLPSAGWVPITEDPWQNLLHVLMPAVSLALPQAAILTRTARSSLLEVLSQDYIRTAYSKGLRTRAVVWRHALKNALIPILTIGGVQMGYLLGGSIIIEDVFQLPGIGKLAIQNLQMRDIPVVQGCLLFYGSFFVLINLLVDLLYSVVDPRITYD